MKKKGKLIIGILCFIFLTGCTKVQELTDDETKVIAEYAADLLLKYDISFDDRISEGEYKLQKQEERGETASTEMDEVIEQPASEEFVSEEPAKEENHGNFTSGTIGDEEIDTDTSVSALSDIATLLGKEDISITYKDYFITDQYPATDEDGKFIYLEASEGYDLLVLQFNVMNLSSEVYNLSLMDEGIDYKIVCNGSKAAKPMLTILMDDLSTLETTLEPSANQDAVLVFQISDSLKNQLEKIQLFVDYNGRNHVMDIQ